MRGGAHRNAGAQIVSKSLARIALGLVLLTIAGSNGCGDGGSTRSSGGFVPPHSASASGAARGRSATSKPDLALEHDFGLVGPGETLRHQFTVRNSSSSTWTIRQVVRTCACSVTRASAESIPPGGAEQFDVQYRMPNRSADKSQTITIHFKEPDSPTVSLSARARVREPMTLPQDDLVINGVAQGHVIGRNFDVLNYSDADWQRLSVRPLDEWITAESLLVPGKAAEDGLRQVWRVVVHAKTSGLSPGEHQTRATVRVPGSDLPERTVAIHVKVMSPVSAVPEQLFFGAVSAGGSATAKLGLHFAPDAIPKGTDSVALGHDLGAELSLRWLRTSGRFWQLAAELTPKAGNHFVQGTITVQFSDGGLPTIRIPVRAMVR